MKVLNVVSVLSAREGGGNAERTVNLSRELSMTGFECTLLTLDIGNPRSCIGKLGRSQLVVLPCINSRFQIPDIFSVSLRSIVQSADVIHLMGYWSLLGVAVAREAICAGIPYVITPAGALQTFGRSRIIKWFFNILCGKNLVRKANGWIAVTSSELPVFQRFGVNLSKVAVIPNGVVESDFAVVPEYMDGMPETPFILFMGRLNPIKGPDLLLEAYILVAREFPQLGLVFAGLDEGLEPKLRQRAIDCGLEERVYFLGFVSGARKVAAYRDAKLLVVPSRSEAMSIVALEAGVCGTPVLMTDQCGLHELKEVSPELIVPVSIDAIAVGIRSAIENQERLRTWGLSWQQLVRDKYLWSDVGRKFSQYLGALKNEKKQ